MYEGMLRGERLVAVKEMKYQEATADQLRDFAAEVSVLATLVHPNIVEFVGACMDPQHMLLVMELVGGGDAMILLARDDVQITWARRSVTRVGVCDCPTEQLLQQTELVVRRGQWHGVLARS